MAYETTRSAARMPGPGTRPSSRLAAGCVIGIVAGVALGIVDFTAQKTAPYPWANLANSPAVWALVAFAVAAAVPVAGGSRGRRLAAPVTTAVLILVVAVVSYYVTASVWQGDELANASRPTAVLWYLAGILAGVLCGIAATWQRTETGPLHVVGGAFPVALLLAEAAVLLFDSARGQSGAVATASVLAALALVLGGALGRSPLRAMCVLAASLPLAAIGYGCYHAIGISGFGA